jgi:hypothetical protein
VVVYLEFLAEEVFFGRELSVESFEFLFLVCELRQLVSDEKVNGELDERGKWEGGYILISRLSSLTLLHRIHPANLVSTNSACDCTSNIRILESRNLFFLKVTVIVRSNFRQHTLVVF